LLITEVIAKSGGVPDPYTILDLMDEDLEFLFVKMNSNPGVTLIPFSKFNEYKKSLNINYFSNFGLISK